VLMLILLMEEVEVKGRDSGLCQRGLKRLRGLLFWGLGLLGGLRELGAFPQLSLILGLSGVQVISSVLERLILRMNDRGFG